jgi:hypothetical protein
VQKLHLVGFTTEHDGLVFSARKGSKAGGYIITLDKELLSTIAEAERLRNGDKGDKGEGAGGPQRRPDSRLTPREIQAYLRAGRSIPEVAAEAGVDPEWVERFAVPIVAEQAQMVERARAMTYSKARLGQSTQPVGTSVRWNLADKGVAIGEDTFEQGWSAFQLQDEVWMIRFRYTSRNRLQVAEWELDLDANELTSRNRLASELGYVEKGRRPPALPAPAPRPVAAPPVRVVEELVEEPEAPEPPPPPAPRRRRRRTTRPTRRPAAGRKKSAARTSTSKKKSPAKKSTTKKKSPAKRSTGAKRSTARKTAARKSTAKRVAKKPTAKRVAKKPARKTPTRPRATRRTTASRTSPRKATAPRRPPARKRPLPKKTAARASAPARRPVETEPELDFEPDALDIPEMPEVAEPAPARPPRRTQPTRPRIAAASAKDAASKRSGQRAARPKRSTRRTQPIRVQRQPQETANGGSAAAPNLSGPLARSLLARRLMARKAAEGDGGTKSQRPLRVK